MVVYSVTWILNKNHCKGSGRVKKNELIFGFTALCRTKFDALACLDYHFHRKFVHRDSVCLDDGDILLKRSVIDSRHFDVNYLMMDGISEPLELSNLKSNVTRLNQIFHAVYSL